MAEEICRRLRFSNEDTEQIAALVANHLRFKDVAADEAFHAQAVRPPEHASKSTWNCIASIASRATAIWIAYEFVRRFIAETPPEQVRPAG